MAQTSVRRKLNAFLKDHTVSVSLHRNGLTFEMQGVPANLMLAVASEMLNGCRRLQAAGFDELTADAGGVHGGALGEVPEEVEWVETRRRVGFTASQG